MAPESIEHVFLGMPSRQVARMLAVAVFAALILLPNPALAYPRTYISGIPDGWSAGDVTFVLATDDGGNGIVETWYALDGNVLSYLAPVTVTKEGLTVVTYWSNDSHSEREVAMNAVVLIDKSSPVSQIAGLPAGWAAPGSFEFSISAEDAYSGVQASFYRIDGGPATLYTGPVAFQATDATWIDYWSVDLAGNAEAPRTAILRVDNEAPLTLISGVPATWSTGNVTFALAAESADASVAATFYSLGGSSDATYSGPVTVSAEGVTSLDYHSVDELGGREATRTSRIMIDKTPPLSAVSGLPGGWSTSLVALTLAASDAASGVREIEYRIGDGQAFRYLGGLTVSPEGTTTVTWWATDVAGNVENSHTAYVRIDRGPLTTISNVPSGWSASDVTFVLSVASLHPATAFYKLGSASETAYSSPVTVSAEGRTPIAAYSIDDLGIRGTARTAEVRIDKTAPTSTISGVPGGWTAAPVTFSLSADDALSGVASIYYRLGDGIPSPYSGPVAVDAEGETQVTWWATDAAGNMEKAHTAFVRISRDGPVTAISGIGPTIERAITFTLTASSTHYEAGHTYYRLNEGPEIEYVGPVQLSGDGATIVRYWSVDDHGLQGPTGEAVALLDATPPASAATGVSTTPTLPATVTLTASDSGSGVRTIYYRLGAITAEYSGPLSVRSTETTTLVWWAIDGAGNAEDPHTLTFSPPSPSTKPKVTLSRPILSVTSAISGRRFYFRGTCAPAHSSAATVRLYLYRKVGRTYRYWRSVLVRLSPGSTGYSVRYSMPFRGTFAARAYHADSGHPVTWSSYRYYVVR